MYIPEHFQITDRNQIYDIIEENSFATLYSRLNGQPYATHLPLLLNRIEGCLIGHFARPNLQWTDIEKQEALAVFQGPHCYISPSWYESITAAVPTWNYVTVHVYGQAEIIKDEQELARCLADMVKTYEKPNSSYSLEKVDPAFLSGMAKGIVGFKLKINKVEGKGKLSQNHSVERKNRIIQQLETNPDENSKQIALLMRENLKKT